jgi:hypothetical protein
VSANFGYISSYKLPVPKNDSLRNTGETVSKVDIMKNSILDVEDRSERSSGIR